MKKIESYWWKILIIGILFIVAWKVLDINAILNFVKFLLSVLTPFFIGLIIAFFTIKPATKLESYLPKKFPKLSKKAARGIGVAVVYVALLALIFLAIKLLLPALYNNIVDLIEHLPSYYETAKKFFTEHEFLGNLNLIDKVNDFITSYINFDVVGKLVTAISSVASSVITFVLGIVFSIYILLERESLVKVLKTVGRLIFKGKRGTILALYARKMIDIFYSYFIGLVTDAIIVGLAATIFLLVFGAPYPVLLGLLVGLGNMIPFFGPIVAAITVYVVCAIAFGPLKAIWVLVFQLVLGQVDGNLLQPKIVGSSVGISPFWVIFAVMLFGGLWGPAGMIIGVPIMAALRIVYIDYTDDRILGNSL
ncbi:MAG: AI-2E family transporter [Clostridia bacterium]|nr:AI-2E family transporter [Clostridia bacterium]